MKRLLMLMLVMACFFAYAGAEQAEPVRIMIASDLHYLSPSLYECSNIFVESISRGDGKAAMFSGELLTGLMEEARHQHPDVLVLSGDLTFNGEKQSHLELAAAMRMLMDEGIRVMVIPGNHDINSSGAIQYLIDAYMYVDNVSSQDFRTIWQGMTADELPGQGISGVVKVTDQLWLAMSDYSVYEFGVASFGMATKYHFEWLQRVTEAAEQQGATIISVSHQALAAHTAFASETYSVYDGSRVIDMLKDAGCCLNLSGHMHLQHILRMDGFTDIATGAWSMSPHRYGMVTVDANGEIKYDAYALCAEHVPEGMLNQTHAFFRKVAMDKQRSTLTALNLDDGQINDMLEYSASVNEAYFAGTVAEHPELMEHPGRMLWMNEGASTGFGAYLNTILQENVEDALHWSNIEQ